MQIKKIGSQISERDLLPYYALFLSSPKPDELSLYASWVPI